jgi:hypothetical protein
MMEDINEKGVVPPIHPNALNLDDQPIVFRTHLRHA